MGLMLSMTNLIINVSGLCATELFILIISKSQFTSLFVRHQESTWINLSAIKDRVISFAVGNVQKINLLQLGVHKQVGGSPMSYGIRRW